jgi:VWFA-related protein
MKWRWWLCCVLVGSGIVCAAQQEPGSQAVPQPDGDAPVQLIPRTRQEREERYNRLHRVLLNVQVTDAQGMPVRDLKQEDFSVFDNQQLRKIAAFRAIEDGASAKAHVLLVLDTLNTTSRELAYERKEIEKFLRAGPAAVRYPISFVTLVHGEAVVEKASTNVDELSNELARLTTNVHPVDCLDDWNNAALDAKGLVQTEVGETSSARRADLAEGMSNCLNRKFQESMRALFRIAVQEANVPGRTIVIWVGAGWPTLTGPQFVPDTPHQKASFFAYLVEVIGKMREAQITLDAISRPEVSLHNKLEKTDFDALLGGTRTVAEAKAASMALPVLASQTGGRVYIHEKRLAGDLAQCLDDADAYYVLAFDSVPAAEADEFRVIEVKTSRPEFTVRSTTVYYAQP